MLARFRAIKRCARKVSFPEIIRKVRQKAKHTVTHNHTFCVGHKPLIRKTINKYIKSDDGRFTRSFTCFALRFGLYIKQSVNGVTLYLIKKKKKKNQQPTYLV